jgi:hypothetical protein
MWDPGAGGRLLNPKPKPKGLAEKDGVVEYGYASRSPFADCARACTAASTDGRGMRERIVGLMEGCALMRDIRRGSSDSDGRVAGHATLPVSTRPT